MKANVIYSCKHELVQGVIAGKSGATLAKGYPMRVYQGTDGDYRCSALCPKCYSAKKTESYDLKFNN